VNAVLAYVRSLNPQLPRPVWLIEAGGVANSLGNGIVIPFLVIYLHDVRHFGLGVSGLVVAFLLGIGIVGSPLAGRVVDRIGARMTLMASLALLAAGYGGFPFVRHPWQAFALAVIAGAGNGGFAPSHSSLLAALTSREQRTAAYALTRVTDNLGFGIGGLIGGLIATTEVPVSFDVLFAVDAGTFVAFIGLLFFVPAVRTASTAVSGGFRRVARDRTFVWLLVLTAVLVAAAYAQVATILPPYVHEHAGVTPAGIGFVFLVNTVVLVIAQLPLAKALGGRHRLYALVVFSLAECIHGAVLNPLVADLAPPELMGRYMGLRTSSFQLGYLAGPTIGSFVLAASPSALWLGSAAACAVAAAGFVALADRTPVEIALTPGRERGSRKAFRVLWRTSEMTAEDPLSTNAEPAPHQAPDGAHARTGGSSTA
jgi:MFS family permease